MAPRVSAEAGGMLTRSAWRKGFGKKWAAAKLGLREQGSEYTLSEKVEGIQKVGCGKARVKVRARFRVSFEGEG